MNHKDKSNKLPDRPELTYSIQTHKKRLLYAAAALLVILLGIALCAYRFYVKSPTETKASDTAETAVTWKTATLTSEGLSFKYPATWTAKESASNVVVTSPVQYGYRFTIAITAGTAQDVNPDFHGNASGTSLLTLNIPGSSRPYYLAAQPTALGKVIGLGLATTSGGTATSFGIVDTGGSDNITMAATLSSATHPQGQNTTGVLYDLKTYQSQPDYQTVLTIFRSLSYKPTTAINSYVMNAPAGWSTFTDKGLGFMLHLPAGWTMMNEGQGCDGDYYYGFSAPTSEIQQSGLKPSSGNFERYALGIDSHLTAVSSATCSGALSGQNAGYVGGYQSTALDKGLLAGNYLTLTGSANETTGVRVTNSKFAGQSSQNSGIFKINGVSYQIWSSISAGQYGTSVNGAAFMNSQLYKDTLGILESVQAL